jgi:hypothetical protein
MSTVRKKNSGTVSLYWVTTVDHSEDWFILAKSAGGFVNLIWPLSMV